ncbi:MAG: hypothetical protein JRH11_20860 [Deltaproteobacteria bacterium]|nr:hypothetical protein [Deltaproteobacteria bacterium]
MRPPRALFAALYTLAVLSFGSTALAQQSGPDPDALASAIKIPLTHFDSVQFINASRGAITAVYELYCAAGMFIPEPGTGGLTGTEIGLGIGCLVGATSLLVMTGYRIAAMADSSDGWDRLARFRLAADDGLDHREIRLFERELAEEASAARFRRGLSVGMGIALVIASGLVFGFTAAGEIEETVGATIGIGTTIVGIMSLIPALLDSPAEAAERAYRQAL